MPPSPRDDGILVQGLGRDRVLFAQRGSDQRGQRDDGIGLRQQLVQQALVARIAAHRIEARVAAAGGELRRAACEVVEDGHLVPALQQRRHQHRADVSSSARYENMHMRPAPLEISQRISTPSAMRVNAWPLFE
jgi:hypothetical protein